MKKGDFNFDLKQLRSFLEIEKTKSFTRASRNLKIGQSTISHQINSLENVLGVKLFNRTSKELSLTQEGLVLKSFCETLFKDIYELKAGFETGFSDMVIPVAASTIPSTYILPDIISNIISKNNYYYRVETFDSREVIERIKEGSAEIGVVGNKIKNPLLKYTHFLTDEIVLIGSMDKPDIVNAEIIQSLPFIARESGSGTKSNYEHALKKQGIVPSKLKTVFQCTTSESVKESVASGMGVSFISKLAIKRELKFKKLKIINIPALKILRKFYIVFLENRHRSRQAQILIEKLLELKKKS
ncbi:LysR substrate-binding domain-containing protein [Spirochaetota bacterium]